MRPCSEKRLPVAPPGLAVDVLAKIPLVPRMLEMQRICHRALIFAPGSVRKRMGNGRDLVNIVARVAVTMLVQVEKKNLLA